MTKGPDGNAGEERQAGCRGHEGNWAPPQIFFATTMTGYKLTNTYLDMTKGHGNTGEKREIGPRATDLPGHNYDSILYNLILAISA